MINGGNTVLHWTARGSEDGIWARETEDSPVLEAVATERMVTT
jgi:hypothetical protein